MTPGSMHGVRLFLGQGRACELQSCKSWWLAWFGILPCYYSVFIQSQTGAVLDSQTMDNFGMIWHFATLFWNVRRGDRTRSAHGNKPWCRRKSLSAQIFQKLTLAGKLTRSKVGRSRVEMQQLMQRNWGAFSIGIRRIAFDDLGSGLENLIPREEISWGALRFAIHPHLHCVWWTLSLQW